MNSTTHGLACPRGGARRSTTIAALLIGSALGLSPAPAIPQPQEIADQVFSESLAVLEVEVPVQVLRDGVPVRGLEQIDFTLFDRGVERPIVAFEVVDLRIAGPGAPASPHEARSEAQRSVLVLVDYSFNAAQLVAQAIDATRQMVAAQLHPRDRVAIVALGARGRIAILTGFTADRDRIEMALELARALADRKRREARELARALDEQGPRTAEQRADAYGAAASEAFGAGIDQLVAANDLEVATVAAGVDAGLADEVGAQLGGAAGGSGIEEAFAIGSRLSSFSRYQASAGFAEAVGNLGSLLRGVSGQKQALLFSQGPPPDTLVSGAGIGAPEGGAMVAKAMERMIEQLGRAGWPVNTFGQGPRFSSALFYLSEETGGISYENRNRLEEATATLIEQTSVTYVLRFVATDVPRDGRRHPLEVRVAAAGDDVEVRHRPHYFAPRLDSELGDVERRIQAAERALEEELSVLEAKILPLRTPRAGGGDRMVLVIQIAARELASLAIDGKIQIEAMAVAQRHDPRDVLRQRVDLDLERLGELPAGGLVIVGDVDLAPDDRELGVSVTSGARGASSVVAVPERSDGHRATLPPLLFAAAGRRLIVREPDDDGPAMVPFRLGGQEQVPHLEPVVQRGDALGVALVLLGEVAGDPAASDLVAGLRLLDETGAVAPAGDAFALDERVEEEGSLQLLFTIDTTALVAGAYAVEGMWPPGIDGAEPSRFRIVEAASP